MAVADRDIFGTYVTPISYFLSTKVLFFCFFLAVVVSMS